VNLPAAAALKELTSALSVDRVHDFSLLQAVGCMSVSGAIPLTTCERLFVGCTGVLHLE
jgi:hypothetical protein